MLRRVSQSALLALVASSCYFEGTAAVHPRMDETATSGESDAGLGYSIGFNIGFYLDVAVHVGRLRSVGVGLSPTFNTYGITRTGNAESRVAAQKVQLRADAAFAFTPI